MDSYNKGLTIMIGILDFFTLEILLGGHIIVGSYLDKLEGIIGTDDYDTVNETIRDGSDKFNEIYQKLCEEAGIPVTETLKFRTINIPPKHLVFMNTLLPHKGGAGFDTYGGSPRLHAVVFKDASDIQPPNVNPLPRMLVTMFGQHGKMTRKFRRDKVGS